MLKQIVVRGALTPEERELVDERARLVERFRKETDRERRSEMLAREVD